MGGTIGTKDPVHPNDHVNLCQSSNDVIPTALHVAGALALHEDLLPALRGLASELRRKAVAFDGVLKVGRTHLMDATPVRMGQEFAGWARQVELGVARVERARDALLEVALGGTATGTGVNRPADFPARAIARIADATGLPFREAADHFEAQGAQDGVVEAHGALRVVAGSLAKIANDVRWMGSGPRAGLGELRIPETQAGSSIMPGKVNPVMSEMLLQVCAQVAGNDVAVGIAGASGVLELNTCLPLLVRNLLESTQLLANGARVFTQRCVAGLEADAAACAASVERNLMRVTALAPAIGYDRAAQLAREAQRTGASLRDVALAAGVLPAEKLDALLDARAMTEPGGVGSGG
jgi:fumarate hydratase class II